MLAYHGSEQLITSEDLSLKSLRPSPAGSFGPGFYLADKTAAEAYAGEGTVIPFEVDNTRLLVFKADFAIAEPFDLDTAALPLLMALFGLTATQAADTFKKLTTDGFLLGEEVKHAIQNKGFDGVFADYGDCFELAIYDTGLLSMQPLAK